MKQTSHRNWAISPDMLVQVAVTIMPLVMGIGAIRVLLLIGRAKEGDGALLCTALVSAGIGVVLLVFARLPLYRQGRYFTFGPGGLDGKHRRLYSWAYIFIASGLLLMALLALCGR